jgi:hypothetical protein
MRADPSGLIRAAIICVLAGAAAPRSPALAQDQTPLGITHAPEHLTSRRPALAGRIVRSFDFEERDTNPLPVPQHWFRAQSTPTPTQTPPDQPTGIPGPADRPGFPPWNAAELDYTVAHSGIGSVRLPAFGGSACLRLEPGVIPVLPGADYTISAAVRTDGGEHARARLTARFLDARGEPIQGSAQSTEPVDSRASWTQISLSVRGNSADAAFLQLDLELLQPREWDRPPLPEFKVWPEDFRAQAWFDDVRVSQLPRVELRVGDGPTIVRDTSPPTLHAVMRDLTGQRLVARLSVRDLDGALIDSAVVQADRGPGGLEWTPRLDRFGWFQARLELFADGDFVGASDAPFGWLPPQDPARAPANRFVLIADRIDPRLLARLPRLIEDSGVGSVVLPVWHASLRKDEMPEAIAPLEHAVDEMIARRIQIGLSFPLIPDELAKAAMIDPRDPLRLMASDAAAADPYLGRLVDRYGQSVQRWLLGSPSVGPITQGQDLTDQLTRADAALGRLVPGPIVAIPWDGSTTLPPEVSAQIPDALLATTPPGVSAEGVGPWISSMLDSLKDGRRRSIDMVELTVLPRTADSATFGRSAAVADLTRQAIETWASIQAAEERGVRIKLGLVDPWSASGLADPTLSPTPELVAFGAIASQLTMRRVVMRVPTAPGIHAYLLEPAPNAPRSRTGAIVAWCDGVDSHANLQLYLGPDEITISDPFLNLTRPTIRGTTARAQTRNHIVPLSAMPVFVEGVDVNVVALAASFRVEPPFIPATNESHDRTLVLRNPFRTTIDIRYYIAKPGSDDEGRPDRSWSVSPRMGTIQIPPGVEGRIPITVVPSPVEESGPKEFVLDAQINADRAYGWIQVAAIAELGLPGVRADVGATATSDSPKADVITDVQITNIGTEPLTLDVAAFAPGFPRQRSSISDLAPGGSVVRRFVFPKANGRLRNERLIVSIFDTGSGGRLNTGVTLDPAR